MTPNEAMAIAEFARGAAAALAPQAEIVHIRVQTGDDGQQVATTITIKSPTPALLIGRRGEISEKLVRAIKNHTRADTVSLNVLDSSKESKRAPVCCSFCCKQDEDVDRVIAGPGVAICNECVTLCAETIEGAPSQWRYARVDEDALADLDTDELLDELRRAAAISQPVQAHIERGVTILRERQVSWQKIGDAIGLTRQGAWAHFSGED